MIIKAKNPKEAEKKLVRLTEKQKNKQLKKDLLKTIMIPTRDLLSVTSFFKYLIGKGKDKSFITTKNTIVGKNKKILEKNHNCKIMIKKC